MRNLAGVRATLVLFKSMFSREIFGRRVCSELFVAIQTFLGARKELAADIRLIYSFTKQFRCLPFRKQIFTPAV